MKKILIGLLLGFTLSAYSQTDNILNVVDNKYKRYIHYMERGNKRLAEKELNALVKSLYNVVAMMYDDQTAGGSSQAHFKSRIDAIFGATFPFPTFSYDAEVNYDSVKVQSELAVSGIVGGLRDTLSYHEDSISSISGRSLEAIDSVNSISSDNIVHWDSISSISTRSLASLDSVNSIIFENIVQWDSINKANDSIRIHYSTLQVLRDSINALRSSIAGISTPVPTYPVFSDTVPTKYFTSSSYTLDFPYPKKQVISTISSDTAVGSFQNGAWAAYSGYEFVDNTNSFKMLHVGHPDHLSDFEIRLDDPNEGTLISTFTHGSSGGWTTADVQTVQLDQTVSGTQDVYIKSLGNNNGSIYWFYFYHEEESDTDPPLIGTLNVYDTAKAVIYGTVNEALETFTYAGWSISADSGAVTVTSGDIITATSFNLDVSRDFKYGEGIELSYSQSTGNVTDSAGNELANLTRYVNNGVDYIEPSVDTVYSTDTIYFKDYDGYDGYHVKRYYSSISDTVVDDFVPSGWLRYDNVEFSNTDSISLRYARDNNGNQMQFRINASDGTLIADPSMPYTTDSLTFSTIKFPTSSTLDGTYDLYVISENWNGSTMWYMFWDNVSIDDTTTTPPPTYSADGDYYFSSSEGLDSNNGTNSNSPKQSISALKSLIPNLQAGDTVLFKAGDTWRGVDIDISGLIGSVTEPIVFGRYGTGADPIFTGMQVISSFSSSGNIWTATGITYDKTGYIHNPSALLINGEFNRVARDPNHPTYRNTSSTGNTYLEDTDSPGWTSNELIGGQVAGRAVSWAWTLWDISSNGTNSISLIEDPVIGNYGLSGNTYYFLQNVDRGLDSQGEWTYKNDGTLKVYYTDNLNSQTVELPTIDTMFRMDNCEHIKFSDIQFTGANAKLFDIWGGTNIDFDGCSFKYAGTGVHINEVSDVDITSNKFSYLHTNALIVNYQDDMTIYDNSFTYTPGVRGMQNNYYHYREGSAKGERWGSAITNYYGDNVDVKYNVFDTLFIAYQTHSSSGEWTFERNLIKDYGWILGDGGAVYMGGDWNQNITKRIRKNIFVDGHRNSESIAGGHISTANHAIYFDYNTRSVVSDSNTIVNTNAAFYHNRNRNNTARHNKIINGSKDFNSVWSADVYMDALIDGDAGDPRYLTYEYNTHVFGDVSNQVGYNYHGSGSYPFNYGSQTINHNTYQDPFTYSGGGNIAHREMYNYGQSGVYSITDMCSRRGYDCNSTFNALDHFFDDVTGITEDEFIKVVYNASKVTKTFPLYDTYMDLDGNTNSTGEIELDPYETKILFYVESGTTADEGGSSGGGLYAISHDQEYYTHENAVNNDYVGYFHTNSTDSTAVNPNYGDNSYSFSITAGNTNSAFAINSSSGLITVNDATEISYGSDYDLTVQVTEGSRSESYTANIKISNPTNTEYIDHGAASGGDGSFSSPHDEFTDVSEASDHVYFIKRGNSATADQIFIGADNQSNIVVAAYGQGSKPNITHSSSEGVVLGSYTATGQLTNIKVMDVIVSSSHSSNFRANPEADSAYFIRCEGLTVTNTSYNFYQKKDDTNPHHVLYIYDCVGKNAYSHNFKFEGSNTHLINGYAYDAGSNAHSLSYAEHGYHTAKYFYADDPHLSGVEFNADSVTVDYVFIKDNNWASGVSFYSDQPIAYDTLRYAYIENTHGSGISVGSSSGSSTVHDIYFSNVEIVNAGGDGLTINEDSYNIYGDTLAITNSTDYGISNTASGDNHVFTEVTFTGNGSGDVEDSHTGSNFVINGVTYSAYLRELKIYFEELALNLEH